MTPAPLYTQRAPTRPPQNFPHRGKYFSIAWKNRQKLFHTVEKLPAPSPALCPLPSALSPDLCPLTSDLSLDLSPLNPEPRTLNPLLTPSPHAA